MDPNRVQGLQSQIAAAQGTGQQLAQTGAGTLGTAGQGFGVGNQALQNIIGGGGPQFGADMATQYQNFMNPSLQGAQQSLANQANMAWNKGVGALGGQGGGFMNSGRMSALGQAQENAAAQLGMQQQQLAFQAANQAAAAGQQAGQAGYQGKLAAANALGQQGLNAAQLTNNLQQAQIMPGGVQETAGQQFQQQRQNELNAQYQNQLNQFQNPFKSLNNLQAGLGVLGTGTNAPNINMPNNIMALADLMGYKIGDPKTSEALKNLFGLAKDKIFGGGGGMLPGGGSVFGDIGSADELAAINAGIGYDIADSVGAGGWGDVAGDLFSGGGGIDEAWDFLF
jgi:uncharacterized membrane protein